MEANQYSGMYRQADSCVVRMANAADPSSSTSYNPNMRIKCFRSNGMESANIQTLWTIVVIMSSLPGRQKVALL